MQIKYTLAVDGFPNSQYASIAHNGKNLYLVPVRSAGKPIRSISERVDLAIERATAIMGYEPEINVINLIDTGDDELEIEELKQTLGILIDEKQYKDLPAHFDSSDATHSANRAYSCAKRFSVV